MKLEKINDNQIRCTLSREDLASRHMRLSELAYGSEKAKELFRELMTKAKGELNFNAEDDPLMIEAIPVSEDCLVLVVTRVDEPDELDTRFSCFSEDPEEQFEDEYPQAAQMAAMYADEILQSFEHLSDVVGNACADRLQGKSDGAPIPMSALADAMTRIYSFSSLDDIMNLAKVVDTFYAGLNSIYKDTTSGKYYLIATISNHSAIDFNKLCNILSEYGTAESTGYARLSYFSEHCEPIALNDALHRFAGI